MKPRNAIKKLPRPFAYDRMTDRELDRALRRVQRAFTDHHHPGFKEHVAAIARARAEKKSVR
jgi:hypothetical protein